MGGRWAGGQAGRRASGQAGRRAGGQAGRWAGGWAGRQAGYRWHLLVEVSDVGVLLGAVAADDLNGHLAQGSGLWATWYLRPETWALGSGV